MASAAITIVRYSATPPITLLSQYQHGELLFSQDGLPRNGHPTIAIDPFLTPEGFQALLASLAANPMAPGTTELRVIPNDLKTPYTDQFSLGVRQRFGVLQTSLTYNHTVGKDQLGYAPLNRDQPNAERSHQPHPADQWLHERRRGTNNAARYHGVFVTVDKPYTKSSGYGCGFAYTLACSKQNGSQFESHRPSEHVPIEPNAGDERHRLVNGIVDLPWNSMLSGLATITSGVPERPIVRHERLGQPGGKQSRTQSPVPAARLAAFKTFNFGPGERQIWAEVLRPLQPGEPRWQRCVLQGTSHYPATDSRWPAAKLPVGTGVKF